MNISRVTWDGMLRKVCALVVWGREPNTRSLVMLLISIFFLMNRLEASGDEPLDDADGADKFDEAVGTLVRRRRRSAIRAVQSQESRFGH